MPCQPQRVEQLRGSGLGGLHEPVVVEVDDRGAVQPLPVRHQALVLAVEVPDVRKIQGIAQVMIQVQEEH